MRIHGQKQRYVHQYIGISGRLDSIQASILRVKLRYFKEDILLRQKVALGYQEGIKSVDAILPKVLEYRTSTFAQYTIRVKNREALREKLKAEGIPTAVHYPLCLHLQECFAFLGHSCGDFPNAELASKEVLSLPMNPYLEDGEIEYICEKLNEFECIR